MCPKKIDADIMKYAEELKIAPNLDQNFITTAYMLKLVKQLRLGRNYLTRIDLHSSPFGTCT